MNENSHIVVSKVSTGTTGASANPRVVRVFIASPGGLEEEREILRRVATEINASVGRRLNSWIEVYGWNDLTPGFGRPQERINEELDLCDLFVGLLHRTWGTPTGKYGSGFEEEFERSLQRRQATGSPELWVYFRQVDEATLRDPGEDLKRVLAFKGRLNSERTLQYDTYCDLAEWERKCRTHLYAHVIDKSVAQLKESIVGQLDSPREVPGTTTLGDSPKPAEKGLSSALDAATLSLSQGEQQFFSRDDTVLDRVQALRLYLVASAVVSSRYIASLLGVHEANALFRHRVQLVPTNPELYFLFRSLAANIHEFIPGWYWVKEFDAGELADFVRLIARDGDYRVRMGAVKILQAFLEAEPEEEVGKTLEDELSRLLEDEDEQVRGRSLLALADLMSEDSLEKIESGIVKGVLQKTEAQAAIARILCTRRPEEAIGYMKSQEVRVTESIAEAIRAAIPSMSDATLLSAVGGASAKLKPLFLKALWKRKILPREVLEHELTPRKKEARDAILSVLFEGQDETLKDLVIEHLEDEDERILPLAFRSLPRKDVEDRIDWLDWTGRAAYECLATTHFSTFETVVRDDINTEFSRIRDSYTSRVSASLGDAGKEFLKELASIEEHLRGEFLAAALAGIVINGNPKDIELGRKYVRSSTPQVQLSAIALIRKYGRSSDAATLLAVAAESYGAIQSSAIEAALAVSPGVSWIMEQFRATTSEAIVKSLFRKVMREQDVSVQIAFDDLLRDDNDTKRQLAVAYHVINKGPNELESVLDEVMGEGSYYYSVIVGLDSALYAPLGLNVVFKRRIVERALAP